MRLRRTKNELIAEELFVKKTKMLLISSFPFRHSPPKVPNVELDFDVSVRQCLLSTHTSKSNTMLSTHLHAMIRTYHLDFNVRF